MLHFGEIAVKRVHTFEELGGEAVILTHRLSKNSIAAKEYILMTDSFSKLEDHPDGLEMESRTEICEGIGEVPVEVHYPDDPDSKRDESTPAEPRNRAKSLANAMLLDGYSLARTLGLRKAPPGSSFFTGRKPGFWKFSSDGLLGLWMLFRGK